MRHPAQHRGRGPLEVKMAPMIDVIFLLLIFFVCTASFHPPEQVLPTRLSLPGSIDTDVPVEELLHAIRQAEQGQRYLPHPIYNKMIDTILSKIPTHPRSSVPNLNPEDRLTTREREVLQLAAEGRTCREIAQNLCVSTRTVETHRGNAMHKLGLSSRIELLRYAISRGLLRTD